jgi:hypothetical protein
MFFKDLSSADHSGSYGMKNALHVGWLEPTEEKPTIGSPPDGFLDMLKRICVYKNNAQAHRGFHCCPFCEQAVGSTAFVISSVSGDVQYYFPVLIVHYVSEHGYLPPKEFIEAVMACVNPRPRRRPPRRRNPY